MKIEPNACDYMFSSPKMGYNDVRRQFLKCHEVWRSNVHDVQKFCFETSLCVLVYFIEFYEFVLGEMI